MVDYYGQATPISQLGQTSAPEARLLVIRPFDKSAIANIEKSIMASNLGVNPTNDGTVIRLPFPALTEEKRKDLVKSVKKMGEDAKVKIRNVRRDFNEEIKSAEKKKEIAEDDCKKFLGEIQEITDKYVKVVDGLVNTKETDLMTV